MYIPRGQIMFRSLIICRSGGIGKQIMENIWMMGIDGIWRRTHGLQIRYSSVRIQLRPSSLLLSLSIDRITEASGISVVPWLLIVPRRREIVCSYRRALSNLSVCPIRWFSLSDARNVICRRAIPPLSDEVNFLGQQPRPAPFVGRKPRKGRGENVH